MIHVDWACSTLSGAEAAQTLVASLRAAGLPSGLVAASLPPDLPAQLAGVVAPLLAPAPPGPQDRLLILSGQSATDAYLASMRRLAGDAAPQQVLVAGRFDSRQSEIGIRARFGYALGQDPELLAQATEDATLLGSSVGPVFGVNRARRRGGSTALRVLLITPATKDEQGVRALQALALSSKLVVTILTDGKSKTILRAAGLTLPIYHYGEAALWSLACRVDAAVFCQPVPQSYAVRMMLADLAVSGAALLDASPGFANRQREPAFAPAPADPVALAGFLTNDVSPEIGDLSRLSRSSALARAANASLADLRTRLNGGMALQTVHPVPLREVPQAATTAPASVVFLPTNGVGLGHAQRCSLIAGALHQANPVFAAFPSCMRLIKSQGFDVMPLVQRSGLHADPLANDVVNGARLGQVLSSAAAFVFDGGYVFNSVFRAVLEHDLPSIWIRRGLWQSGQDNSVALEREKVFDRVIVPLEAFDELNEDYSCGPQLTKVGPILRQIALAEQDRSVLRHSLAERYGLPASRLVVSMLGGGVAADRRAQTTAIAVALARRPDVLHLVVVWPTATIDPGLFAWPNTRVVRSHHAPVLAAAADLFISAVGYNSFHEAMYNRVPTIFLPQMAAYMDDQRARALAAVERGLARMVEPHELSLLDRIIARLLDSGEAEELRARLAASDLPAQGAEAAAACIAELAGLVPRAEPQPKTVRMA
jgi:hypothetical protein